MKYKIVRVILIFQGSFARTFHCPGDMCPTVDISNAFKKIRFLLAEPNPLVDAERFSAIFAIAEIGLIKHALRYYIGNTGRRVVRIRQTFLAIGGLTFANLNADELLS